MMIFPSYLVILVFATFFFSMYHTQAVVRFLNAER